MACGYTGQGVSTTNLAGRILANLILDQRSPLERLPLAQRRLPRWEPEPLRWFGSAATHKTRWRVIDQAAEQGRSRPLDAPIRPLLRTTLMFEICYMSAADMTRMMQAGELSAREVLESHWEQIDRLNPTFNAIVTEVREQSMAAAKRADEMQAQGKPLGPLHGLPIAHKDLFETAGIRTTFGSPLFKDYVPVEDDPVVQRIRQAGAITIGKTNTPEFGAGSQTFNTVFGRGLATLMTKPRPAADRAAERPLHSPAACCRSPTGAIWADRSAIRPRSATWWDFALRSGSFPIRRPLPCHCGTHGAHGVRRRRYCSA